MIDKYQLFLDNNYCNNWISSKNRPYVRRARDRERRWEDEGNSREFDTHGWFVKRDAETWERSGREEKGKEK